MSKELNHHIIHTPGDCPTEANLFDYIDNKLSQKERHLVEKHLLGCELCSDAIEGLELIKNRNRISTIRDTIDKRIETLNPSTKGKIIFFNYKIILSAAATIALLIIGVFFFNQTKNMEVPMDLSYVELKTPPPLNENEKLNNKTNSETKSKIPPVRETIRFTPPIVNDEEADNIITEESPNIIENTSSSEGEIESSQSINDEIIIPENKNEVAIVEDVHISKTDSKIQEKKAKVNAAPNKNLDVAYAVSPLAESGTSSDEVPLLVVEHMPEYPGGEKEMMNFISKNYKIPPTYNKENTPGSIKIFVQLTVGDDGTIRNPKIIRGINTELDTEALRVVKLMPKWKPGQQNGRAVSVIYNLPIRLELK